MLQNNYHQMIYLPESPAETIQFLQLDFRSGFNSKMPNGDFAG
ncbi:hypothetical protein [Bacillus sp. M6-12]|nr:hypothetical protein [Bacillus sp. M6-12]